MTRTSLWHILVLVWVCSVFSGDAIGQFVKIDDFESYTVGTIDGQSDGNGAWIADGSYEVTIEPGTTNKVLNMPTDPNNMNASKDYSNVDLPDGSAGTLYFRFQRGGEANHIIYGLSPSPDPVAFGDFEASISARTDVNPGRLQARSGGGYVTIHDFFELDEWINIWMVIDNDLDEFQVYAQSDVTFPDQQLLDDGGNDIFVFRNGTADPLTSFYVRTGLRHEGPFFFDDIYLDPSGENLDIPSDDVNPVLQAGDADQDLDFDQIDLVKVQIAAKYLTGTPATWGEGDWDAAPGGEQGNPPAGDGQFNQLDIISALASGTYLTGPYAAINVGGVIGDEQTSLVYDATTGALSVDSPGSKDLTSINISSASSKFIGDKPSVLDGAFDNFAADNIFKATFGGSFGDISFGNVLPAEMSAVEVAVDLTAVGSLAGGGDLGDVDLVYIPEPATLLIISLGALGLLCGPTQHAFERRMFAVAVDNRSGG